MQELTVTDTLQLQQLIGRCVVALDFGDDKGYAQCFAADGEVHLQGIPQEDSEESVYAGYARLREHAVSLFAVTAGHVRHFNTNAIFSRCSNENAEGILRDRFVRVEGMWKIQQRTFRVDPQPEHSKQAPNKMTWMKDAMLARQKGQPAKGIPAQ
jgi:polysaccharide pyruvyl transferase WcaK-like protein